MGFHPRSLDIDEMEEKGLNIYPNKGLDKEKETNNLLIKCSETHINTEPGFDFDSKYSKKEPSSEDSNVGNDKYTEGMVQELQDCLPVWVSQDQVLNLLTRSGGNVVEAVSDFYERETEYHEQVIAFRTSSALSQKSSVKVPTSIPNELVSDKSTSIGGVKSILSQEKKISPIPIVSRSSKTTVSPRKRGSGVGLQSKQKKKGKPSSTLRPTSGSKQPTITKFFNKV